VAENGGDIYYGLEFPRSGPDKPGSPSRPYVVVNMVSSVDGKARVGDGGVSGLGSPVDRSVMRSLRAKADAVMVGAGTVRAERLSLGLDEAGMDRQPTGIIVSSGTESLPFENLVSLGEQRVVVLSATDMRDVTEDRIEVLRAPTLGSGAVDLRATLEILKGNEGIEILLVEGGPSLNAALFARGLVDELFLTLAPKLLGGSAGTGSAATILDGAAEGRLPASLRLLSAFVVGDEMFLRYAAQG
jgi:riboflavin-specific deaminase-like protein